MGFAFAAGACGVTPAGAADQGETATFAPSAALAKIRSRGEVAVGVRTDFPPFGTLDAKGRPRGLEVDLARMLADHLGVDLRLVPVTMDNRLQRLQQGAIQILIAGVGDPASRHLEGVEVQPHYYGSGVNVLMRPERTETQWRQLRGSTLCAVEGAGFNAWLEQRHRVSLYTMPTVAEALYLMQQGHCVGLLYSEAALQHLLRFSHWREYRMPLASALVVPWSMRVAPGEQGSELEREIGNAVARWHREGTLIALERKWGLRPSAFLWRAQLRWSERRMDGRLLCARDAQGHWPADCRSAAWANLRQGSDRALDPRSLAWAGLLAAASIAGGGVLRAARRGSETVRAKLGLRPREARRPQAPLSPPMWALLAT
jgi:polar amino acid transport system substrate-binding protein